MHKSLQINEKAANVQNRYMNLSDVHWHASRSCDTPAATTPPKTHLNLTHPSHAITCPRQPFTVHLAVYFKFIVQILLVQLGRGGIPQVILTIPITSKNLYLLLYKQHENGSLVSFMVTLNHVENIPEEEDLIPIIRTAQSGDRHIFIATPLWPNTIQYYH